MATNAVTRVRGEVVTTPEKPQYQARVLHTHEHTVNVKSEQPEAKNVKTVVDDKPAKNETVIKQQPVARSPNRRVRFGPILAQITTAAIIGAIVLHADNAQGILTWFSSLFHDVAHLAD